MIFLCCFFVKPELVVLGGTGKCNKLGKKKEIKIVRETDITYTFLDTGLTDIKQDSEDDSTKKTISSIEKGIMKTRSIDSKKAKIRYKNRIAGGQIQQSHSSVYE